MVGRALGSKLAALSRHRVRNSWEAPGFAGLGNGSIVPLMSDGRAGYSFMYRIGFRPWEFDRTPVELVAVAERIGPARALELGCGTGRQAVELANRGWDVTAVDYVPRAIDRARARAEEASASVRFLVGDVTRLGDLGLDASFDLVYDNKCFHGLPAIARPAYVAAVARACSPGGTFVLFALGPSSARRMLGLPSGIDQAEVRRLFGEAFELMRYTAGGGGPFAPAYYEMAGRRRRGRD